MEQSISRKGFLVGSLAAGAGLAAAASTASADESAPAFDAQAFNEWLKDRRNFSAAGAGDNGAWAFLPGEENAPTDDELVEMLRIANSYQVCHALGAPHFVVVRDPEEQQAILSYMGFTGDGTVLVLALADGCKDDEYRTEPYTARNDAMHYWQMYYSLIELGEAAANLNMAARSKGYRIHNYGAVSIPNTSYEQGMGCQDAVPLWSCGGDWDMIRAENWDIAKYCHPKDGGESFTHFVQANDKHVDLDPNLTLVYAIAIGTVDEDALETSVTSWGTGGPFTGHPQDNVQTEFNFSFWDTGVDGNSLYEPTPEWTEAYAEWEASDDHAEEGAGWAASTAALAEGGK